MRWDRRTAICACFSAALGVSIAFAGEYWLLSVKPNMTIIKEISVKAVDGHANRWLEVTLYAPPADDCVRQSQHLIFSDKDDIRTFIPLGSALNGMKFSSPRTDLVVSLELPPGIPPGIWYYVDRSVYTCVIWPGFVTQHETETSPTKVVIP
jgi:hypothetical protein